MASPFPHVTITVASKEDGTDASGELNTLSLGFGLHQAWIYAAMFSAGAFFNANAPLDGFGGLSAATLFFIISLVAFGASLIAIGITNQLFLRFYVSKQALALAALLTCVGTLALFLGQLHGALALAVVAAAGIATGVGSGLMIALWGTAFARYEFTTIILNTAVAIAVGVGLYLVLTHLVPPFAAGIITSLLPAVEAFVLWKLTPIPYFRRREIPIFHPLAVKPTPFLVRLILPVLVFGFALGAMRTMTTNIVMPAANITVLLALGAAVCLGVALIIATIFIAKNEGHWDLIFRTLTPFIALGIFSMAFLRSDSELISAFMLIAGYVCFEALMWIFFADLAQEFRLSPIFVFGLGRGTLALGSLAGSLLAMFPVGELHFMGSGLSDTGGALLILLALVVAYAISPRQREIKAVAISPAERDYSGTDDLKEHLAKTSEKEEQEKRTDVVGTKASANADGAEADAQAAEEGKRAKGRFHAQCEAIADRYLLSRRETEVMFLLAKGHNASFIQEQLCISKSTAKTHINHIYRKLDIHTQQELLSMVEAARKENG